MGLLPSVDACMPRHTGIHAIPSRISHGKHRQRPEHKPNITTRLRPHCNSPQPQHGPDGIACTTR